MAKTPGSQCRGVGSIPDQETIPCQVRSHKKDLAQRNTHIHTYIRNMGFPGSSAVKNPPANAKDVGLIPGSGRPLEKEMAVFLRGKSHGRRSLVGYSPWGCKRGDLMTKLMTKQQ